MGIAKRETTVYAQHKIDTVSVSQFVFSSVYDNQWFFTSNDLASLKALLNRADRRREQASVSLGESESFSAAVKHLPGDYAGMIFLDPRPFAEKLMPLVAMTGAIAADGSTAAIEAGPQCGGGNRLRSWKHARDRFRGHAAGERGRKIGPSLARRRGREHVSLLGFANPLARKYAFATGARCGWFACDPSTVDGCSGRTWYCAE